MIIVGKKPKNIGRFKKLKGKVINGYLVIEDILYVDHAYGRRHKCLCKCVVCGSIRRMDMRKLKNGEKPCSCNIKFTRNLKFKQMRGKMLKTLNEEINRLSSEALFEDDYRRIENLKEVLRFIQSESLKRFFIDVESVERSRKIWKI